MKMFQKAKDNILEKIENKNLLERYLLLILGIFIYSVAYNVFFVPNNLVIGGSGGIALILKDYIDPTITILCVSVLALLFAYVFLGPREVINMLVGSVLFPMFVELTKDISLPVPKDDIMLVAICGAVLIGFANGIIGKTGLSSGGVDSIVHVLSLKLKISSGNAFAIVNGTIVVCGSFMYGWRVLLYALIILYIINIVTDKVMLSVSMNKTFFIVTTEVDRVKEYFLNNLSRGVTILDAHGGFTDKRKKVIMVVIPSIEYFKAKEGILEIDKDAFFTITDSYQVIGQDSHRNKKGGIY